MREAKIDANYYEHVRRLQVFKTISQGQSPDRKIELYYAIVLKPKRALRIVR